MKAGYESVGTFQGIIGDPCPLNIKIATYSCFQERDPLGSHVLISPTYLSNSSTTPLP